MDNELRFYTVGEVATLLRISRSHVHALVKAGELPAVRFGKVVRIAAPDVESFIQANAEAPIKHTAESSDLARNPDSRERDRHEC